MTEPNVVLTLDHHKVLVERDVFAALFENSVMSGRVGVQRALGGEPLPFRDFLRLARQADIPYPLFFAPMDVVREQLSIKTSKLMAGFTKTHFSMHSRQRVELQDVELIVKDLLRKQQLLRKYDRSLVENTVVGLLAGARGAIPDQATRLMRSIGVASDDIRGSRTKEAAVDLLISRLEARQILVSQNAQNYMPQAIPRHVKFSGMTIKDRKVPFIFLSTGNEGEHLEPAGRKLFTLVLLTVLIAEGTFAPVNYDGHSKDESSPRAYELTAEILMPRSEMRAMHFNSLQSIKDAADLFRVTPSAVAMRARRLAQIDRETFETFMDDLRNEYTNRVQPPKRSPLPVNALRKYNGIECSRRMLSLHDAGKINSAEFRRLMFFNKLPATQIADFREALG